MREIAVDDRRLLVLPGDAAATLAWSVEHFITCANQAIADRQRFVVALSGGSTPNGIYRELALPQNRNRIQWQQVLLFWSDERAVPPNDGESNYHAAMESGIKQLGVPKHQIFRMEAEGDTEAGANRYETCLNKYLPGQPFDLVMLGMGDDGHVASLFPHTRALDAPLGRRAVANEVPQKGCWRMSLTFAEINQARVITCYVIGKGKAQRLAEVLQPLPLDLPTKELLPAQRVGTPTHPCLWIADTTATELLRLPI